MKSLFVIILIPIVGVFGRVRQNENDVLRSNLSLNNNTNQHCEFTNPLQREECGFAGITPEECQKLRCCFDDSIPSFKPNVVHWCFKRSTQYTCSADLPQNREECGWPGISRRECEERRCCFNDEIKSPDVRWCFYGQYNHICDNSSPLNRYECGFPGISEQECHKRKCCFDDSIKGVPAIKWCFHKTRDPCEPQVQRRTGFTRPSTRNREEHEQRKPVSYGFGVQHLFADFHNFFQNQQE